MIEISFKRKIEGMKKVIVIVLVIIGLLFYPLYTSYYHLDVTLYEIESEKISEEVNIVVISDVHDEHCKIKEKIIQKIEELKPDLILCVGDIIDDTSSDDQSTIDFITSLVQIAPVYYSIGNHEDTFYKDQEEMEIYEQIGAVVLNQDYVDLEINGQQIRLGGLYNYAFDTYKGKIDGDSMHHNAVWKFLDEYCDTDSFKLMMAHRPDSFIFGDAKDWDLDLCVSGHYHGGQVILPVIGGLFAPELGWLPEITYGSYQLGSFTMLVTRGISSSKETLPRYNNPCEIMQVILK